MLKNTNESKLFDERDCATFDEKFAQMTKGNFVWNDVLPGPREQASGHAWWVEHTHVELETEEKEGCFVFFRHMGQPEVESFQTSGPRSKTAQSKEKPPRSKKAKSKEKPRSLFDGMQIQDV